MKKIVFCKDIAEMDNLAQEKYFMDGSVLMENAARDAFSIVKKQFNTDSVLFLCGGGNNGGDGLVMVRLAHQAGIKNIRVFLFSSHLSTLCEQQKKTCMALGIKIEKSFKDAEKAVKEYPLILDALFGTGFHGDVRADYASLIEEVNNSVSSKVVSLDIPSGMGDYSSFSQPKIKADMTITFGLTKACLFTPDNRKYCGNIVTGHPGFPEILKAQCPSVASLMCEEDLNIPSVAPYAYKNTRGRIGVFGGSVRFPGAPVLCATASYKSGAGKVTIIGGEEMDGIKKAHPEFLYKDINDKDFSDFTGFVCGPGWGTEGRQSIIDTILSTDKPVVVDADALLLSLQKRENLPFIITPHMGEYACLTEKGSNSMEFINNLKALSEKLNAVVVLKSHITWICYKNQISVVDGMNPSIGVGGSGDILSGIICEFANYMDQYKAAVQAVLLHQKAARRAAEEFGTWFTPVEFLTGLGKSL